MCSDGLVEPGLRSGLWAGDNVGALSACEYGAAQGAVTRVYLKFLCGLCLYPLSSILSLYLYLYTYTYTYKGATYSLYSYSQMIGMQ